MNRKVILRFVLVSCLAIAGLAAFLGLMASGQEQVYASSPQSVRGNVSVPLHSPVSVEGPNAPLAPMATILRVATTGTNTVNCGTVTTPCLTIQYAVDQAVAGDEIRVAAGTYTDTITRTAPGGYDGPAIITQVVYITNAITIRGGYTTTDGFAASDPDVYITTLDAEGEKRVIFVGGYITVTLENLHITSGDAAGLGGDPWGGDNGGGVYIISATTTLSGNDISGNNAYNGGGVYIKDCIGETTLKNNHIYSNAARDGGGVYARENPTVTLSSNTICSNTASYDGGGLYLVYNANVTPNDNIVCGNTANYRGGGGFLQLWNFTGANNIVADNQANFRGSGMYVRDPGTSLQLAHTTIAHNIGGGSDGVGVCVDNNGTVVLTNTILVSHTVGITVPNGTATLIATLWGTNTWANTIDWGGAGTVNTGTINIWDYPDFVNPSAMDYHIGLNSGAIDAGVDAGVYTDRDGVTRPQGGFDLGAYEVPTVLSLKKMVDAPNPNPGQRITYTIVVTSSGGGATNVLITDTWKPTSALTIAGPVTLDPDQPGAILATSALSLPTIASNVTITAGESVTVTFPVTVSASLSNGTVITNTAAVTSTEVMTPEMDWVLVTVTTPPNLTLTKDVDNANPSPGQLVNYTVVVANSGGQNATGALITDTWKPTGALTIAGPIVLDPPDAGITGTFPYTLAHGVTITAGESVTVTFPVTVNAAGGTVVTNTAAVTSSQGMVSDISLLTVTVSVSEPEPDWKKLVYVNGTLTDTDPITVTTGNTVTIVDRVWVTHTAPVTFTLVETWTGSLDLTSWISTTGSAVSSTNSLTWTATGVATNTWHILTKTFSVIGGTVFDYVTETLEVEDAASQLPDQVLTFYNPGVCIPVSIDDLVSDSPVELGEAMHFTATVSGDTPITYSWDFDDDGTPEQIDVGLDTISYTYGATGDYTATLVVTNACGTDNLSIVVTVSPPPPPPEPDWDKEVYINGTLTDTFPASVLIGDMVEVVDWIWITYTAPVTFTLVETWTNSLELQGWISDTGSVVTSANSLTWTAAGVATNTWHILTKTFLVTTTGWTFDYITETLDVEDGVPVAPWVLTFLHGCEPVTSVDFDWLPTDPEPGDVVTFTANSLPSYATPPIAYTWDISGLIVLNGNPVYYTFPTSDTYTVTVSASSPCGGPVVTETYGVVVSGTTIFTPSYGVLLEPPTAGLPGDPGSDVVYTLWMTNTGNVADLFNLSWAGNTWATDAMPLSVNLPPSGTQQITVTVTVTNTTDCSDSDTVIITATSQLSSTVSDSSMLTTSIIPSYTVTIEPATDSGIGAPGEAVTYTLRVTNTGGCNGNFAMSRLGGGWSTLFSPNIFLLDAKDGQDVIVTVTIPSMVGSGAQDVATVQVEETVSLVTDTSVLTTAVSGPALDWEKLVYVNGTFTDTSPIIVTAGDVVTIVDRVWVTYTPPVTFTLVETWTDSLDLTGWISTTGSIVSSTNSLTWTATGVATSTWHVLTKTFDVTGTAAFGYVTETLDVEGAAQLPDQTLIFRNTSVCVPVSIDDLISDSPVELGEAMHFTATVSGDTPITYSWDFDDDGTPEQIDVGLDTISYTYGATGDYTATLVVTNACGTDNLSIVVTVSPPPEPDWDKEVYINGTLTDTFPASVLIGDMVEVVDWVWITYTAPVTFTLVETWTNSLELQGWISTTGSIITSTDSLTWAAAGVVTDTWHVLTKTFLVTTTGWTFDYITETLDVEDGVPVAPRVLTFLHGCEPVTSVDFDWLPTDPEPGDVVTFTANSLPSYATPPIAYTWDISGLIVLNGNPVYYTFPTSDTYTVTVSASSPCGGPVVTETYGVVVSGTTIFTPSYGVLLEPPMDTSSGDPGSDVVYTLWMTNTGNVADLFNLSWAGDTWATDVAPPSVNLPPSGTQQITVTVTVTDVALCGDFDTVVITATSQLSPTVSDSSVLTTAANPVYGVAVDSALGAKSGSPTDIVTYTLQVTNTGNCADTFNISTSGAVWTTTLSANTIGPLSAGLGGYVIVTVTVTDTTNCGEFDAFTVNVTSTFASDSYVLTTSIVPSYSVTLEPVSGSSGIANPTEMVTYTLRVTNTGGCDGNFAMSRPTPGWHTDFSLLGFLGAKDGQDVVVTITVPSGAKTDDQDVATIQVRETTSSVTDTTTLTTTASGPVAAWDKQVLVDGTPEDIAAPIFIAVGNVVQVVDRVWITHTVPATFTLVETWTNSLDLTGWISSTGSVVSSTNSLTWTATDAATSTWHVFTKTFDVLAGTTDTLTESMWLEGATLQPGDKFVQFTQCEPVSITSLTSDSPVIVGTAMNFTATVSGDVPITYTWDFDSDGTPEQSGVGLSTVNHLYASTGDYTVTLDVENGCPSTATLSISVTVNPVPCVDVNISNLQSNSPVIVGTGMNFTATVSGDVPITYTWDFDSDGTPEQSGVGLDVVSYIYAATGDYTVTLDVDNGCPSTDTQSIQVTVNPVPCVDVNISNLQSNSPVVVGTAMNFTATVSGDVPITYTWDFDSDGTPEQSGVGLNIVSYVYPSDGTYTVTLDVDNGCPSTDTQSIQVTVNPPAGPTFTFLPATDYADTPYAIQVFTLTITNNDAAADTFSFTAVSTSTSALPAPFNLWNVVVPADVTVGASLSAQVPITVEIPAAEVKWVTHTATITATSQTYATEVASTLTTFTGGHWDPVDARWEGCRFDFDDSGRVMPADILETADQLYSYVHPLYDFDHSGRVMPADILVTADQLYVYCDQP